MARDTRNDCIKDRHSMASYLLAVLSMNKCRDNTTLGEYSRYAAFITVIIPSLQSHHLIPPFFRIMGVSKRMRVSTQQCSVAMPVLLR